MLERLMQYLVIWGAQIASGKTGAERLNAMCDRYELDDIGQLADEIISRSEASTREAIKALLEALSLARHHSMS